MDDEDLAPGTPDPAALKRRVLLSAAVTFVLFAVVLYLVDLARAPGFWVLLGMALVYAFLVRPLMRPVHDAVRLRRRLAYQAYLDSRESGRG